MSSAYQKPSIYFCWVPMAVFATTPKSYSLKDRFRLVFLHKNKPMKFGTPVIHVTTRHIKSPEFLSGGIKTPYFYSWGYKNPLKFWLEV